ncbi:unnamed protein product [Schistosoma margrebowiei]|uniref:Uncharacterized protein n=1 Tax=Schistosoma margrebowiei TaxID=48269 RepID=A0A183LDQ5_9TREM|nr:unnamed protein product [Schistosoma margrebowiei]VDO76486.1 unnamed protein product [Schistosoma margrebowiei]
MKASTPEEKHRTQWTGWMQPDDSNFVDDLTLLSHTHQQTQMQTKCSSSLCISRLKHTQGRKQDPQIQHGEQQPNHT